MEGFGKRFARGFSAAKQFASEKIGNAEVTAFPNEYVELEKKTDRIKFIYEQLLDLTRQYVEGNYYDPGVQDKVKDTFGNLTDRIQTLSSGGSPHPQHAKSPVEKTLEYNTAKIVIECAQTVSVNSNFGEALRKYGITQEKLAGVRSDMDENITNNFLTPFSQTMETTITFAVKARKVARQSRLELDAIKSSLKGASPDRMHELQVDLSRAEEQFAIHVEDAIISMKAVIENPDCVKWLADLVEAQRSYHKQSYEILNTLVI